MPLVAALCAAVLLSPLAVLQIGVAAGAPWGHFVWGGKHRVLPLRLRIASGVSVALYAGFAAVLLGRAGLWAAQPGGFLRVCAWVLLVYFVLGTVANLASRSRNERLVMTPACAALAVATAMVIFGN